MSPMWCVVFILHPSTFILPKRRQDRRRTGVYLRPGAGEVAAQQDVSFPRRRQLAEDHRRQPLRAGPPTPPRRRVRVRPAERQRRLVLVVEEGEELVVIALAQR